MRLEAGANIDQYELVRRLGRGGMGEVWSARPRADAASLVALKMMLPQLAELPEMRAMFLDEARVASMVCHPNVVKLRESGEADGTLFMAFELVEGASLAELLGQAAGEALAPGVAVRIALDVCAGLEAAHRLADDAGRPLDVIHRDVAPPNILIDEHGAARLIDFGIAKARERLSRETSLSTVKGRLSYMSPEQASGEPVDHRTDVWSTAVVLFQMLTGHLPFVAENQAKLLRLITDGARVRVPEDVAASLAAVLERALATSPGARFASALEMADALAGTTSAASPETVAALVRPILEARRAQNGTSPAGTPSRDRTTPQPPRAARTFTPSAPRRGRRLVWSLIAATSAVLVLLSAARAGRTSDAAPDSATRTIANAGRAIRPEAGPEPTGATFDRPPNGHEASATTSAMPNPPLRAAEATPSKQITKAAAPRASSADPRRVILPNPY